MIYDMEEIIGTLAERYPMDEDVDMLAKYSALMVAGLEYDPKRRNVAIDFDGTIHSYDQGWTGIGDIPGKPIPGAIEFIQKLLSINVKVTIFSCRCNQLVGIVAMQKWLEQYGIMPGQVAFQPGKPPFHLLIDDHAVNFYGEWREFDVEDVVHFKDWTRDKKLGVAEK